jgi:hypothetical protein
MASWIDASPFVVNPGYVDPPVAVPYYFTARDAFRGDPIRRTDIGARYTKVIPNTLRAELFVQFHILNAFNYKRAANAQAFAAARTAFTEPARFAAFNPFSQSPVAGVHWDTDPRLSDALETATTTLPRAYRLTVGVRF